MADPAPALTHRRVLTIALPIVLSNATVPILGLVDTGVVGQIGEAAPIAAVGLGAVILGTLYWVFGFLRMGTTGLAGQARGAGRPGEVTAILTRALLIGGAAGCALILLQAPLFGAAFLLSPASSEVEALARDYMGLRIWSAPAAIALFGINGWLIAGERTRAVLAIQLWMNGLNIGLDFLFVMGLGWSVQGVALATVLAEWSGVAVGLWFCRDTFRNPAWRDWPRVFDTGRLRRMMTVNLDILLRSLALMSIMTSFLFFGARFGEAVLAANHILMQFITTAAYVLDGFAFAAEALVAQAVGAASLPRLRESIRLAAIWSGIGALGMTVVFALAGGPLIDLMAKVPSVQELGRVYLPWMVAVPVLSVASFLLDGIFIGATRSRDMRNMMLLSAALYFALVAALMPVFGNHGLWAALLVAYVARAGTLALRYPALERAVAAGAA